MKKKSNCSKNQTRGYLLIKTIKSLRIPREIVLFVENIDILQRKVNIDNNIRKSEKWNPLMKITLWLSWVKSLLSRAKFPVGSMIHVQLFMYQMISHSSRFFMNQIESKWYKWITNVTPKWLGKEMWTTSSIPGKPLL